MDFEIDVSGSDLLSKNYTIVVAEKRNDSLLMGYKFDEKIIKVISSKWGKGEYKYSKSKKGKANLKIRLYCIAIFYIFKALTKKIKSKKIHLDVCRDFQGREGDIKHSLNHLLSELGFTPEINFLTLGKDSIADRYAFLLRKDSKNKFSEYLVKLKLKDFEYFLKK